MPKGVQQIPTVEIPRQEIAPTQDPTLEEVGIENVLPLLEESVSPEVPPKPLSTHTFKPLKVPTVQDLLSSLRRGAKVFEKPFVVIYNINRLFRNIFRAAGGLVQSVSLLNVATGLGILNAFGIMVDGRNMLDHALMVFAPNRTAAQRASSLVDALKSAAWVVGDLAIMMSALIVWVNSTPGMQAFAACGKYFVVTAFMMNIVKHVIDLCFYYQLKHELEADVHSKINYATLKDDWDKRISNYNIVLRTLLTITAPEFLKVLNELDTHLKASRLIDDGSKVPEAFEGEKKEGSTLDQQVNEQVRYALLGRVTDKIAVKKVELVANLADTIALAVFIAIPPSGLFVAPALMGINFIATTILWGIKFRHNEESVENFEERVKKAAELIHQAPIGARIQFTEEERKVDAFLQKRMDDNVYEYSHKREQNLHPELVLRRGLGSLLDELERKGYKLEPLSDKHRRGDIQMVIKMNVEKKGDNTHYLFGYYPARFLPRELENRGWVSTTEWVIVPE